MNPISLDTNTAIRNMLTSDGRASAGVNVQRVEGIIGIMLPELFVSISPVMPERTLLLLHEDPSIISTTGTVGDFSSIGKALSADFDSVYVEWQVGAHAIRIRRAPLAIGTYMNDVRFSLQIIEFLTPQSWIL